MTNPHNQEHDRAVHQYMRNHPGITLEQARHAIAAHPGHQHSLPTHLHAAEMLHAPYPPAFVDRWPTDAVPPPVDPEVHDEVTKALGAGPDTDTPPHE
ncbi:hypothetical protein [Streptomyces prunicolor]|uniref:hypothetical protein n=1 Tax=Streptomyces prunicolor TaxID=67348 RepID=UPI0003651C7A|nr:hypothetical protein [Streptomyces prunicolor]